jgi:Omp85 superfamily domain
MTRAARRSLAVLALAFWGGLSMSGGAAAAAVTSGDPSGVEPPAAGQAVDPAPAPPPAHRELNIVPIAGGDSDVGIGVGYVGDLASLAPGYKPYRWRLESEGFITFNTLDGGLIIPFQDYSLLLTIPDLGPGKRVRLDIRGAYTDEATLKYYGIGNATPMPSASVDIRDTEYGRVHPTLTTEARIAVSAHWFLQLGNEFTYNKLTVRPTSLLASAQSVGTPEVRAILGSFASHGVDLLEVGVEYDSRDNETVTHHGMFHELQLRVSPPSNSWLPYGYQQVDGTFRFYGTPVPRWLSLSFRAVGDVLLGSPPFYELARFDETPAIGGGKALRGVPAQRYYGKVKVFENFEARSELFPFHIMKKALVLGVAAFLDAGRSWTELAHAHPELDGTGLGIKYGIGGGLRLQEGQTFVVRLDLAWSPDATPVGAYFAAGEIF